MKTTRKTLSAMPASQRGVVMVFTTIAMLVLIAMSGLALDMGHAYVNKTRLQNAVDASALAAAKVLDETGDQVAAIQAANTMFALNANAEGNKEVGDALANNDITVITQFSDTLNPFVPDGTSTNYVRVSVDTLALESWLIRVLGINEKTVGARAVAGPSANLVHDEPICGLAPMVVCGDAGDPPDPNDPTSAWGYEIGQISVLKTGSKNSNDSSWEVGPGNFQLIRLDGGQGGDDVREAMAGSYDACLSTSNDIETEPGNTVGPVAQGLNTRFGSYQGNVNINDHPPDVVVTENTVAITEGTTQPGDLNYNYDDYEYNKSIGNYDYTPVEQGGVGVFERRILRVPIANCDGTVNGQGTIESEDVLSFGCFYLLQQVQQKGNEAEIYSQFVSDCGAEGVPGPEPSGTGPGVYKIILHKDPDSIDS